MSGANIEPLFERRVIVACCVALIVVMAIELYEGRVWWCPAGDLVPWSWQIWSEHNSQHLIDPYSFTHVLHGIIEYYLLGLIFRRLPVTSRLVLAVVIEGSWEVLENSNLIIDRYRTETISLNYHGDSIINSMSDILCCLSGFALAHRVRGWVAALIFAVTEIVLTLTIHDSLIINLVMLIYPIAAIKKWQMGG